MSFSEISQPPRILAIGAHPDDCDIQAGGSALLWAQAGYSVCFVSVTNGEAGHHEMSGAPLVERRKAESQAAADLAGIEYLVMDFPDGQLIPGLEERFKILRLIRNFRPDLILTHRPNDYHPDHRYTSQLVQDCSYLIGVPNICPETPRTETVPVIAYFRDHFKKPIPFQPDVVVDIDAVMETKIQMLDCHRSQLYEWLPWIDRHQIRKPKNEEEQSQILLDFARIMSAPDHPMRTRLQQAYGESHGAKVIDAEAFEISEYGAQLDPTNLKRLFPFYS